MRGKLDLDPATVRHAKSLARKAGRPIVTMAKKHTTVSVERATLRLAGLGGADEEGTPWVNRLMDVVRADVGLEHGVALPVWDALLRGEGDDLTALAQKAAAGSVTFRLPEGKDATRARAASRKQVAAGRDAMPGGSARGVGQGNEIERVPGATDAKAAPDDLVKFRDIDELRDREFADGKHEPRSQNLELALEPGGTIRDLLGIGHAVAPAWRFPGKAAANRREINLRPHRFLSQAARFLEPTEECLAGSPGKWFSDDRFAHSGRLADEQNLAHDRAPRDGWRMHERAAAAVAQTRDMLLQPQLFLRRGGHSPNGGKGKRSGSERC